MAENDNPSLETKKAIKEGINWLADWYRKRCDAGMISNEEYEQAINQLKNVRIYTTKQGMNRLTEELQNQTLHFSSRIERSGATVLDWQMFMMKNNVFPLGYCAGDNIKEPVILLDIDAINEKYNNDPKKITSKVIHELTHLTAGNFGSEQDIIDAMNGIDIDDKAKAKREINLASNKKAEVIEIVPNIIKDTDTPLVIPDEDNTKKIKYDTDETRNFLRDNVFFNPYLDNEGEVYARIMELRYNAGLNANESVNEKDLEAIEDGVDIINRYKPYIVKSILNDVALKDQMKIDDKLARYSMAQMKKTSYLAQNKKGKVQHSDEPNLSGLIVEKKNDNSYS